MPYDTGMVTDTGTTARMPANGGWVDVPVLIRDGHYCLCGDAHGVFPRCVGSAWSPDGKLHTDKKRSVPKKRTVKATEAPAFFPLVERRLPHAIPQDAIDACPSCGPHHDAFYYCEDHRSQAIRNVLIADRTRSGMTSLHMLIAEQGFDIAS
jgi:hypothetical protein